MPNVTPNLGLKKPLGNENFTRQAYNENLDILDANAESVSGAQAKVDAHAALFTSAHGATSAASANRIPVRDANGQFNVGTPTASTHVATKASVDVKANTASPSFTGTPTAPTASAGTSNTQIATTAFVATAVSTKANTNSPTFTGTVTIPTPTAGTNTTQAASTAFVQTAIANSGYAKVLSGSYTGNDAANRDIALPFTPVAVLVLEQQSSSGFYSGAGGLAVTGSPSKAQSGANSVVVGTNKFTVSRVVSQVDSNIAGVVYNWIAIG